MCWPLIALLTIGLGTLATLLASYLLWQMRLPPAVSRAIAPAFATIVAGPILFFLIHTLVPRFHVWITGVFVFLSTLLGVMPVLKWGIELSNGQFTWSSSLPETLQTVTAVGVTWYWFMYFRHERDSFSD